jgi:hypothetical protein
MSPDCPRRHVWLGGDLGRVGAQCQPPHHLALARGEL